MTTMYQIALPALIYIGLTAADTTKKQETPVMLKYLELPHQYDLKTTQAITNYLPDRFKALQKEVANNGIQATIETIAVDTDLDSFLFILDAEKPYRMLAYSRTPAFTNKTPQELQQLLAPTCTSQSCSIEDSFSQIAFIAGHKIITYTAYWWPVANDKLQHYISYSGMVNEAEKQFIIGVTMPYPRAATHIILPHRARQMMTRIKKEGFENIVFSIGRNTEFAKNALLPGKHVDYDYFLVKDFDYPNRRITHRTPSWIGITPEETADIYSTGCTSKECSALYINKGIMDTVRNYKEGFFVYLWRDKPSVPSSLKIEYITLIKSKGKKYTLSSGLSANIPGAQAEEIMKYIDKSIDLIKDVGLDNAISTFKRSNTPERYVFINIIKIPHSFLLHINPHFDGKTSAQVQAYLNENGQSSINIEAALRKISIAARDGAGFVAYEWLENATDPKSAPILKVAYTKLFTVNGEDYTITAGIPIDQTQAAATNNQAS